MRCTDYMAKISFYFDEMMPRKVANQLIERGYKVLMAVDAGMVKKDDLAEHLKFATEQGYMMVTFDRPFSTRAMALSDHAGVICWTGVQDDFGGQVLLFGEFADHHESEEVAGRVFWIKRK
jgi:Domain of unknown function (DUF5615)